MSRALRAGVSSVLWRGAALQGSQEMVAPSLQSLAETMFNKLLRSFCVLNLQHLERSSAEHFQMDGLASKLAIEDSTDSGVCIPTWLVAHLKALRRMVRPLSHTDLPQSWKSKGTLPCQQRLEK